MGGEGQDVLAPRSEGEEGLGEGLEGELGGLAQGAQGHCLGKKE